MKKRAIFCNIFIFIAMLMLLTVQVTAASTPWDPYVRYIPERMSEAHRHLRGIWICTVLNLDWPSKETRDLQNEQERIQKSKEELIAILDHAEALNINALFFQVSPEGDALYRSELVPWSRYLTGTFGKDPGFDPLAFVIEQAQKRNMELHAWFNPYRVSMNTNTQTTQSLSIPKSVFQEKPGLIRTARNRYVVDPGLPEARQWVYDRVMEVVENYDIDGIHFDDYFYYENSFGELKDQETYQKYNQGQFSNIRDWRRNNTYVLVKELSEMIHAAKPWVKFGISPAGVWGNIKDGHLEGSNTTSSFTNYDVNFADTKKWVEEEIIDYIAPQIYFTFANPRASYGELGTWWADVVRGKNVHLYIGQALYKINDDNDQYFKGANALREFSSQLKFNASHPHVHGSILFRANNMTDNGKQQVIEAMKNELWHRKALVPVMPWKGGAAPEMPASGSVSQLSGSVKLTWTDHDPNTSYFAIYRFNKDQQIRFDSGMAANLIATVRKEPGMDTFEYIDTQVQRAEQVKYVVAALDRLHHESEGRVISENRSAYFADVGPDYHWAKDAIDEMFEKQIILGDGKGNFFPSKNTKRADFVLMVVRGLGLYASFEDNFLDVAPDSYYFDGLGIARRLGITQASDQYFRPDENITREDMMVIVVRALIVAGHHLELASEEILNQYQDQHAIGIHARPAVAMMTKAGYIKGSNGRVAPGSFATRAEIAVMLHRILIPLQRVTK